MLQESNKFSSYFLLSFVFFSYAHTCVMFTSHYLLIAQIINLVFDALKIFKSICLIKRKQIQDTQCVG